MNEVRDIIDLPWNVSFWKIINMETVIFDSVAGVLARVHLHMSLRGVEDVGDSDSLQIVDVADGVAVAEDDAIKHLVTVDPQMSPLVIVTGWLKTWWWSWEYLRWWVLTTWQWSVFSCSRVNDGVNQLVSGCLSWYRGRLQSCVSKHRGTELLCFCEENEKIVNLCLWHSWRSQVRQFRFLHKHEQPRSAQLRCVEFEQEKTLFLHQDNSTQSTRPWALNHVVIALSDSCH